MCPGLRAKGFLANRHRADKLALCRRLLAVPAPIADDNDCSDSARNPGLPVSCARRGRSRRGVKACGGVFISSRREAIYFIRSFAVAGAH